MDRCDKRKCPAGAVYRADFKAGHLVFCAHHWQEIELEVTVLDAYRGCGPVGDEFPSWMIEAAA